MKFAKLALALSVATLLPSLTFAGGSEDPVLASFERDMNYVPSDLVARPAVLVEKDPLVEAIRTALGNPAKPKTNATSSIAPQASLGMAHGG